MRRTTWAIWVAGLLVAAISFAPAAAADDMGDPPAGVSAPEEDDVGVPVPGEPSSPVPAEVVELEAVPLAADELPPSPPPPPPPIVILEDVSEVPPTWMPGSTAGASYAAVGTVPLAPSRGDARSYRGGRGRCGPRCEPCCPRWEVLIEGALTCLESPCGRLGEPVPAGTPALDWSENDYCLGFGGRLSVSLRTSPRDRFEFRGGYLGQWDKTTEQTGAFGYSPPAGGVSPVGPASLQSEAELYGGEWNYWRQLCSKGCWQFDAGIGMRYVNFSETATVSGLTLPNAGGSASMQSEVSNQLFAGQLSGAVRWDVARRWELSLLGKALLGGISRHADVTDDSVFAGGPHSSSSNRTDFGWGFEVEGRVLFRITQGLGVTAGAAMLYLGEADRAADTFDLSQSGTGAVQAQQVGGGLFAVTLLVGLQLSF